LDTHLRRRAVAAVVSGFTLPPFEVFDRKIAGRRPLVARQQGDFSRCQALGCWQWQTHSLR